MTSFNSIYLTKGPLPHAITLGVSTSTYEQLVHNTHVNAGRKILLPMRHVLIFPKKEEIWKGIQITNGLSDYNFAIQIYPRGQMILKLKMSVVKHLF